MDANSAPSLVTKEISDLSLGEVLSTSLICVVILLAVLISFGIKTYLHLRKTRGAKVEKAGVEAAAQPSTTAAEPDPDHGAPTREVHSMLGGIRKSEPAMGKFDPGS